jgi:peptide chain release factor 2
MTKTEEIKQKIAMLEAGMQQGNFWENKERAQATVKEINKLRGELATWERYDRGNAIMTILSGAGGDDAEDFSQMLFNMYRRFAEHEGFAVDVIHKNVNNHGGVRNITFEIIGKQSYGLLKNESGVHRLVRVSPFSAKKLRHTSFSLVEVLPKFEKGDESAMVIPTQDLKIEFTRSSGPGGQNVNKRETAVRVVHLPTNTSVVVQSERSQERNRELALNMLRAKLFRRLSEAKEKEKEKLMISKTTDIEWGNQIRSYVLHPYKMVKDHRTGVETSDVDSVLHDGKIKPFLEAEKNL